MANIDLSQFHEVFFEESFEGLETIENGLLNLDSKSPDPEIINNMFRAAHSIKGGAGTFGFKEISDFTHVVESILDDARSHARPVTDDLVQKLLESVDFMKKMLVTAQAGEKVSEAEVQDFVRKLTSDEVGTDEAQKVPAESIEADVALNSSRVNDEAPTISGWVITIDPRPELFLSGHDPYRLIRELSTLGPVEVKSNSDDLPDFEQLLAERCYLSFEVTLNAQVSLEQIESVFEWIDEEATIIINPIEGLPAKTLTGSIDESDLVTTSNETSSSGSIKENEKAESEKSAPETSFSIPEVTSIRVNIDRVDQLVNLVGELVITQSMISRFKEGVASGDVSELIRGIEQLEENTRELQDHTMKIRMLPIDSVFQRLPRLVRDVSRNLGKEVELTILGNTTEVDKTVLEKITDPLTHLVRNSLDHGIESKANRIAADKSKVGNVEVKAYHEGGSIIIEVTDDGAGLNREKIRDKAIEKEIIEADADLTDSQIDNLIFAPGFSTAEHVTDVSGRGVGMDVVKNNIEQLNGHIQVESIAGKGSKFTIRLPLTLSIIEGQLVRVGSDVFIIPLLSILESTRIDESLYGEIAGDTEMYRIQGDYIRIVRLDEIYKIRADHTDVKNGIMVVVNAQERYGILVDEVLGQQQVVVKSLETNFKLIPTVSGATILGDGTVAMILDIASLFRESFAEDRA